MAEKSDRAELERRLEQCRRLASGAHDPLTQERLRKLIVDLEEQLCPEQDRPRGAIAGSGELSGDANTSINTAVINPH
jgi:hypothetical protein